KHPVMKHTHTHTFGTFCNETHSLSLSLPLSLSPSSVPSFHMSVNVAPVGMLLAKMKTCVDTYTNRLRSDRWYAHTDLRRAHTYTHTYTNIHPSPWVGINTHSPAHCPVK